jgi:hypothetical protein
MERAIEAPYLERLADAYAEYFSSYDAAPVLVVATEHFNPAENDRDFARLADVLAGFEGRRAFLAADAGLAFGPDAELPGKGTGAT